ncbi:MAG TPA: AbrB family transcriptional regulator [Peptococcaceae bacterium]|nr:AbrB family transcriptional regulator [Peptococcaceae bacterium]
MTSTKQVAVKIDNKGRVTLPKRIREALGVESGDIVFLKYDPENRQVRLARALNPFDVLAEQAIKEYQEGRTRTIEEFAREHDIEL